MASSNTKGKKRDPGKFFKGIRSEVKKVNWPSRDEVWQYTLVVLAMVVISAVGIGLLDTVFQFLFNLLV